MQRTFIALLACGFPLLLQAGPVDINTADAQTIAEELNGVGVTRARAIVEYRDANGAFESADDLLNVSGIGEHILDANRENILLSPSAR
jgi:competence protein ComEA